MRFPCYFLCLIILFLSVSSSWAQWEAAINVTKKNPPVRVRTAIFGLHPNASDSIDVMDIPLPGEPPNEVELYTAFKIVGIIPYLRKDIKQQTDSKQWELYVRSDTDEIILTWNISGVPLGKSVLLRIGSETVDMRLANSRELSQGRHSLVLEIANAAPPCTRSPLVTGFAINGGASSTTSQAVTLNHIAAGNPTHYMASHSSSFSGASWLAYSAVPSFTLSAGSGVKKVYFRTKNGCGISNTTSDTIVYIYSPSAQLPALASFAINNGAVSTTSHVVTLNNTTTNSPTHYMAGEDAGFSGGSWLAYSSAPSFTLSAGYGTRTVYIKVKNDAGESGVMSDTIEYIQQSVQPPSLTSFAINNGAVSTTSQVVTLNNTSTNSPTHYMAGENAGFSGGSWLAYFSAPSFTLSAGYGTRTVYLKVKNDAGESDVLSDAIEYISPPCTSSPQVTGFAINGGASSTTSQAVTLNYIAAGNPTQYMASHSSSFSGASWMPYSAAPTFTLSAGTGIKKVYFKTKNDCGVSNTTSDTIVYIYSPSAQLPALASFAINNGAVSTTSQTVALNNTATNSPTHYMAGEDAGFSGGSWLAYSSAPSFTLSAGYGTRTVYIKVKNDAGESGVMSDTIEYIQQSTQRPLLTGFAINNGASGTTSQTVTLNHTATNNPTHYMASQSSGFSGASWLPYSAIPSFTLSAGYGVKKVYLKVRNAAGESNVTSDTIVFIQSAAASFDESGRSNFIIQWREMSEGWNLVSFSVGKCFYQGEPPADQPACVDLVDVRDLGFSTLADWFSSVVLPGDSWQIVIGSEGAMDSGLPEAFNTLGYMSSCSGYQVRVHEGTGGAALALSGLLFDPGCPIKLHEGWNLVGCPTDTGYYDTDSPPDLSWVANWVRVEAPVAEHVFASVSGKYSMITSDYGAYDPGLPPAFSSMHYIAPGCAYWIKMKEFAGLLYPSGSGAR